MPIQFPSSPTVNQEYTYEGKVWAWDGSSWVGVRQVTGVQKINIWAKQSLLIPKRGFGLNSGYNATTDQRRTEAGTIPMLKHNIERNLGLFANTVSGIVTYGLVLNLDAGNVASYPGTGTAWTDLSGNGNNATLANGPTYSSANDGSIVFDKTNDYIIVPSINRLNTTTLDVWFNTSSVSESAGVRQYLYTQQRNPPVLASNTYQERQGIHIAGNVLEFQYLDTNNTAGNIVSVNPISANTWYNVVVTLDGTTPKMYLNGTQVSVTGTIRTPKALTVNQAFIARRGDSGGNDYFGGNIGAVKDYDRALSAAEVAQNYNVLKNRYGL